MGGAGLLALTFVASCGGGGTTDNEAEKTRVAGVTYERAETGRGAPAASASVPTTTTAVPTTAPAESAVTEPVAAPAPTTSTTTTEPEVVPAEPAIIEVRFDPAPGDEVTATLEGSGRTASLASGVAVFDGLEDGTYRVVVTITHPTTGTDDTSVSSREILRSQPITVVAGDYAVVTCTDGCTAVL